MGTHWQQKRAGIWNPALRGSSTTVGIEDGTGVAGAGGGGPRVGPEEGQETPELRESKHSDLLRPHCSGHHGQRERASQEEECGDFPGRELSCGGGH